MILTDSSRDKNNIFSSCEQRYQADPHFFVDRSFDPDIRPYPINLANRICLDKIHNYDRCYISTERNSDYVCTLATYMFWCLMFKEDLVINVISPITSSAKEFLNHIKSIITAHPGGYETDLEMDMMRIYNTKKNNLIRTHSKSYIKSISQAYYPVGTQTSDIIVFLDWQSCSEEEINMIDNVAHTQWHKLICIGEVENLHKDAAHFWREVNKIAQASRLVTNVGYIIK